MFQLVLPVTGPSCSRRGDLVTWSMDRLRILVCGSAMYPGKKPQVLRQMRLLMVIILLTALFCALFASFSDPLPKQLSRALGLIINMTGPSWQIWRNDEPNSTCYNYKTRFSTGLPRVWLASFPCSGNTWTRYLLEAATGIFTGSVYNDRALQSEGFLGNAVAADSGRTLVQKTHGNALFGHRRADLQDRYDILEARLPTILLLRHPAKAIISYWKLLRTRRKKLRHTAQVAIEVFQSDNFHRYVNKVIELWEEFATDRLLWCTGPLYVLHYELLVVDPEHYLRDLLNFLRVPVEEDRLACLRSHLDGPFKRKGSVDFDPFTEEEKRRMSTAVARVHRLLLLLGYPGLITPTT
ncbi:sialate:O-sulfotransferase 1 isoform X3 [Cherax quadricarinatus]|uniref:sialate:O-sulfotransferase 1 isoform X3 n=1 Tax=Cherax quadricarinatus TaxID=27406 RepID=UPI00387E5974